MVLYMRKDEKNGNKEMPFTDGSVEGERNGHSHENESFSGNVVPVEQEGFTVTPGVVYETTIEK
jgi:hypothetical protein